MIIHLMLSLMFLVVAGCGMLWSLRCLILCEYVQGWWGLAAMGGTLAILCKLMEWNGF